MDNYPANCTIGKTYWHAPSFPIGEGSPGFPDLFQGTPTSRLASYRNMLVNLLPQGFPWRNLNTIFRLFLESFAVEMDRLHGRSEDLIMQSNPGTAISADLLKEWERMALLSDELPVGTETEAQRQALVAAKVTTNYSGPSRQFFITLATRLGLNIVITEGGTNLPARVGSARVGTSRVNGEGNVYIWNIQFLIDTFEAASAYWVYDGDQDFTTYPDFLAVKAPAGSTFISFHGGPLLPALPYTVSATYPVNITYLMRCIFSGVTNQSFGLTSWAVDSGFVGDYVFFNFSYIVASGSYQFDLFGQRNGMAYTDSLDTHIPLQADITFKFNITLTPTGFTLSMPDWGISYSAIGFVFPTLADLEFGPQRLDASNQGMLGGVGIYTDDPSTPFAKFKLMVERLKPAHTQVTYN